MTFTSPNTVTFLFVECVLALLVVLVAGALPSAGKRLFGRCQAGANRLARHRLAVLALVGCSAPVIRLALLPWAPIPEPKLHDEFSYLLAAETFASGKLTNNTHPMWTHFETFHESHQPTYMSMYFPAQGLFMAAGKVLFGHPWYGVCLSVGLMCAAICWMLYGFLPPGWALLGGVLVVMRIGVFSYWMNSYWGGAVPALGGALLVGGFIRLKDRFNATDSAILAAGLALLANSRPFEGLILGICVLSALALSIRRQKLKRRVLLLLAPALAIITLTGGAMAYYNYRVFGSPLTFPYQINRSTYAVAPFFVFQSPRPAPAYRHALMRDFYLNVELPEFERAHSVPGYLKATAKKAGNAAFFFLGPVLCVALIALPRVARDGRTRFAMLTLAVFGLGISLNAFIEPHYVAPVTCLIFLVIVQSLRHLAAASYRHLFGASVARLVPLSCALSFTAMVAWAMFHAPEPDPRSSLEMKLNGLPGKHLAIVNYAPSHDPMYDWVYNSAEIDSSKVVWARAMGTLQDRELVNYFKDRKVWLVQPDSPGSMLSAYSQ